MKDFSWKVFTMTGDVDAYMLYKESQRDEWHEQQEEQWDEDEAEDFDYR